MGNLHLFLGKRRIRRFFYSVGKFDESGKMIRSGGGHQMKKVAHAISSFEFLRSVLNEFERIPHETRQVHRQT